MKSFLKKFTAIVLTALMLVSSVPVMQLAGIQTDSTESLVPNANAAYNGLSSYSATAAVEWAKAHWNEVDSVLWGTNYWDNGGDCANFVSQCIYMGGLDQTPSWNHAGYLAHFSGNSSGSFIRAQGLHDYVVSLGATSINNPSASQISVGDLMFYSEVGYSRMTHSAIVVDIVDGVPIIAAHSVRENGVPKKYVTTKDTDWHLGFLPSRTYLVKMYGDLCSAENPRSFDVYTAAGGDLRLYNGTSSSSGYNTKFLSGEYVHVYSTVYANGYTWGYAYRYGYWGWIKLNSLNYQRHVDSYVPSHIFGEWQLAKAATCVSSGLEERICSRCGYTETRGTSGEHVVTKHATCLEGGFCDLCAAQVEAPLGHSAGSWVTTKEPTCLEEGAQQKSCTRCDAVVETGVISALGHNYTHVSTAPSCTENGTAIYKCTRCSHQKLNYISDSNTWTDWTTEVRTDIPSDKIQTKTQYRYKTKSTTDSYTENLSGWTLSSSEWIEADSGSYDYADSYHGGFDRNNYYYYNYVGSAKTPYESSTQKTVVSTSHKGYVYWHWCRGETDSYFLQHSRSVEMYATSEHWKFHAFYSTTDLPYYTFSSDDPAFKYSDAGQCCDSYWWVEPRVNIYNCTYTSYNKLFHYYKWSDWSSWSDSAVSATDSRQVETRTLYKYDLAAYGHDFSVSDTATKVAPTCTEPGYEGKICSRCGVASPETTVLSPLGHNMGEWYYVGMNPDAPNWRVERRDCQRTGCGYYELWSHNIFYDYDTTVAPTCTEEGYERFVSTSGDVLRFYIKEPLGHESDNEWIMTKAPTCEEAGVLESKCVRHDDGATCDKVFTDDIAPLGHTEEIIPAIEATCTDIGYTEGVKCSLCQKVLTSPEKIEALGHLRTDKNGNEPWVIISEPSCGVNGVKRLYCQRETCEADENGNAVLCNALIEEIITPALSPEWYVSERTEPSCIETGLVTFSCKTCEKEGKVHTFSDILEKTDHTWPEWTDTVVASEDICVITHRKCQVCGEAEEYTKFNSHDFEVITLEGECVDGEKHICKNCGYEKNISDALSHEMGDWYVVTPASCTEEGTEQRDCAKGDYSEQRVIPAHGHDWEETENTSATCTEWGHIVYVCKNDSTHTYELQTDMPTGHNFSEKIADDSHLKTPANCTESARYYYDCTVCDAIGNESYFSGDPLGHDMGKSESNDDATHTKECQRDNGCTYSETEDCKFGDWYTVTEPTCTAEGEQERACTECGYKETAPLTVVAHIEGEKVKENITEPTCTEDGKYDEVVYCTECGKELSRKEVSIPATDHDWGEWETTIPAKCEEEGLERRVCKNDPSHIEENTLPATDHAWKLSESVDPTCTEWGYDIYVCENDSSHTYSEKTKEPIAHNFNEMLPDEAHLKTPASCTVPAEYYFDCTDCDAIGNESYFSGDPLGHDMGKFESNDDATHTKECQRDNGCTYSETEDCKFGDWYTVTEPTCTAEGEQERACTECGYKETAPLTVVAHIEGEKVKENITEPTCTEDGKYDEVVYCTECGKELSRKEVSIPATDHNWGEWTTVTPAGCEEEGLERRVCKNDASHTEENVLPATDHNWGEWTTVIPAGCEEEGLERRVCKNDASHTEENVLPATDHDWDEGTVTTEPTCNEKGEKTYICNNNSEHTYKEEIAVNKDNHISETYIKEDKAPTCEEAGYTGNTYCAGCDEKLSEGTEISAHGHDYKLISEKSKAPDYGVSGYDYYECSYDDSHNYKEEIAALVKNEYTATFIVTAPFFAEDKVVGKVVFQQGDRYINEPAVEKYDNYIFSWDEYELKDEDIVIYGRYTEIEVDEVSPIVPSKTATAKDGIVTITLGATAETRKVQILAEDTRDVDVILVLDQSGSMAETLSGSKSTKRDALVDCANEFVNKIYENAVKTGADHRVAVVGFAYSEYNGGNYKNTGMLASANGRIINYKDLKTADYQTALLPIADGNKINSSITNGINSVVAEGATAAHLGLEMANNIFAVTPKEDDRDRIVIFITDGTPTSWGETTSLVDEVAAKAITEADELKNSHGATVYSVGVHSACDPSAEFTSASNGITTDRNGNFKSYDFNRFLHAVSSNYPDAKEMKVSGLGEGSKQSGYYFGVTDTDKLSNIFSKILLSKVYEIVSFDKVTLFDTLTKEFTLTLEQEAEMRDYLIREKGVNDEDITVTRNADGTTCIRIENVRTEKVYNADSTSYYKASVSFNVSADWNSLGLGGNIATNTDDAGIEINGSKTDSFEIPVVTLEENRNLVVFTIDGVVYRIDEVNMGELIVVPENADVVWSVPDGAVVENEYTVFEANASDITEYTVTWKSENSVVVETYFCGDIISIPEAAEKDGYTFLRWSPSVPSAMPAQNITFTAVYTYDHTHSYTVSAVYGECQDGITSVYSCACGDSYEETAAATEHSYRAVCEKTDNATRIDSIVCANCGKHNSQSLTYKVSYKENRRSYVLDLTLYENEVTVQPDGTLQIRFYLGEDIDKNFTVYRISENGRMTTYSPKKENGYLIFDADHFSIYIIGEIDPATNEPYFLVSYNEALCALYGHSYDATVSAPTCTENGYTEYVCSRCNDTYRADETAMLGHDFGEYAVVREATCTKTGLLQAKCSRCSAVDNKDIELKAHTYDEDGFCTECGREINRCPHICHKDNIFARIVWTIIITICEFFHIAATCSCGEAHY